MKSHQNISASVRQRLLNRSKKDNRPFNELLQYYAMERFLYRLSLSSHAQHYILKGALMLRVWNSPEFRSTMDIDMLGKTGNEETNIIAQICDILAVEVEPDGLAFDSESIQTERITEDADYEGIRVRKEEYTKRSLHLIKLFNKGLKLLKESGKYDQIFTDALAGKYKTLKTKWNP